jgi:hypothetical protein
MILDGKKVFEALDEYEKELFNEHINQILKKENENVTTITAAKVMAVREIRDRLGVSEIKA